MPDHRQTRGWSPSGPRSFGPVLIVCLALAFAGAERASAQVSVGLNVGPSLTNLSGGYIESSHLTAGIYLGAMVEWQVNRRWAIESGITSVQKGAFSVVGAGVDGVWDVRTSYLQIPLRGRYLLYFADDKWIFGPFVGVSYSFAGSCEIREAGFPAFDDDCTVDTALGPSSGSDFMYSFGLVLDRIFGTSAFGVDVRFARGTKDLFTAAAADGLGSKTTAIDIKFRLVFPHFGDSRW